MSKLLWEQSLLIRKRSFLRNFNLSSSINSGNRTKWNPIRFVITRVITKLDDREVGVRFVNHELIITITISEKHNHYNFRKKQKVLIEKKKKL